jgi:MFS family permease
VFAWYEEASGAERRTFWGCFGGWALDAMDVQLYSLVIPTLIAAWGISKTQAGMLATSALLLSAVGGWIAGLLSDRIGRVRTLQITILWFAFFTFVSGFAQNFEQLFVARALMGLGFGAEWAAGAVLMGEVIRAEHRGKAVGTVQSGWAVGWAAAALLYAVLFSRLPEETAWRALFFAGILPAGLVLFVRNFVDEPAVFTETQKQIAAGAERPHFLAIFEPELIGRTLLAALLATGAQGGYYAITTWLPTYLKTVRGFSAVGTGGYTLVLILGAFFGFVTDAYLADGIGRKSTFMLSAIASIVLTLVYLFAPISNAWFLPVGFVLGYVSLIMFSPMGSFMTELYPTAVRGTGQGFCYNAGRGIGALFPALVGYLATQLGLTVAIAVFSLTAYGIMIVALLLLPETRGRSLASLEQTAGE